TINSLLFLFHLEPDVSPPATSFFSFHDIPFDERRRSMPLTLASRSGLNLRAIRASDNRQANRGLPKVVAKDFRVS
ncbi:MAG: hypothetical protein AAAB21_06765, partial [Pseudomonas chlororaphis]